MSLVNGCVLECHNYISIAVNSLWVKMELYQSGPVSFSVCEFPLCHLLMMGATCENESAEGNFWYNFHLWNLFLFFAYHLSSSRIAEYRHVFLVRISKATNKNIKTGPCYQNTEWHNGLRNTFSFSRYRFEPCLHQVFKFILI